jgi:uncharacterized protein YjbI with pentapeptide repeats
MRKTQWVNGDSKTTHKTKIENIIFKNCDLTESNFQGLNYNNVNFDMPTLIRANFSYSTLKMKSSWTYYGSNLDSRR